MMGRFWLLAAVLTMPTACSYIQNPPSGGTTPASARRTSSLDEPLPASGPIREPYTTYMQVNNSSGQPVGYAVRYEEIPGYVDEPVERLGTPGSVFIENRDFKRIGFITAYGEAYSFRGPHIDPIGQRPLEEILPKFFGEDGLTIHVLE